MYFMEVSVQFIYTQLAVNIWFVVGEERKSREKYSVLRLDFSISQWERSDKNSSTNWTECGKFRKKLTKRTKTD